MFKKQQGREIVQQYIHSEQLIKRYIKGNLLGKGGFAKCYQFTSQQTNRKYAAKIIQKSSLTKPKAKQKLQSQIKIHKSLNHHHIVNFQHFFQDQQYVYILLQICRPETLNDLLKRRKRITEFQTKYYIHQITQALKYVHNKKVIHRDLKLGNLFLTDQLHIKVGDFGLATKLTFDNQRKKTTCGTPNYLAPEILINKNGHSYQVDIWSIGVITYALLFGRPPFETNDLKLTYSKIKSCNYSFPDTESISSNAKKFITKILQLEPHKRPTVDQILQDQFITSVQIPKSLPLATISIPPSANFMKKYEKINPQMLKMQKTQSLQNQSKKLEQSGNLSSFRTLERNKIMMSTDKLEMGVQKKNILQKSSSKQNLHMQRAASTAGLLNRKKNSFKQILCKQITKQNLPVRVIYFEQNQKFGISYMLSTNAVGMRYNDSTCIIMNSILSKVKYVTMQSNLREISSRIYDYDSTPSELSKKIKIINHYMKQLKNKKTQIESKMSNQMRILIERTRTKENVENVMNLYVVRSLKTSKAQFFQFNNQMIQVVFQDSSEVIFKSTTNQSKQSSLKSNSSNSLVTYITKFSQLKQFTMNNLQNQTQDVKKRMNYALSVTEKVKKTLQTKQNMSSKQNKVQNKTKLNNSNYGSVNPSLEKDKQLGRSSSTSKFSMHISLNKQQDRHYTSKAKLKTLSQNALKQITNKIY